MMDLGAAVVGGGGGGVNPHGVSPNGVVKKKKKACCNKSARHAWAFIRMHILLDIWAQRWERGGRVFDVSSQIRHSANRYRTCVREILGINHTRCINSKHPGGGRVTFTRCFPLHTP